jgi:hypothetical protein
MTNKSNQTNLKYVKTKSGETLVKVPINCLGMRMIAYCTAESTEKTENE